MTPALIKSYLAHVAALGRSERTIDVYGNRLRQFPIYLNESGDDANDPHALTIDHFRGFHDELIERGADEAALSPPPRSKAIQPNRMSPAGIPMFYGASTFETACAETLDTNHVHDRFVTGGVFHPIHPLNILDLYDLPDMPSFWDESGIELRETMIFLGHFASEIAKPIERGKVGHVEYVPTQAMSEYVRYQVKTAGDQPVHGICYRSSKTGEACYVVFCEQKHCVQLEPEWGGVVEQMLGLDDSTIMSADAASVAENLKTYRPKRPGMLW